MKHLGDNLKYLRKLKGFNQAEVADKLGCTTTAYGAYERGQNVPPLEKIHFLQDLYNSGLNLDLTIDDLLSKDLSSEAPGRAPKDDGIDLIGFDAMQVKVVSYKVQAGYLTSYENLEFQDNLDAITIPRFGTGSAGNVNNLMAFEVSGDSMLPRIEQGDFVICRKFPIESDLSYYINKKFVVNTGDELLVKKLKSFDKNSMQCVFASDNPMFEDIPLDFSSEVAELWKVERIWGAEG